MSKDGQKDSWGNQNMTQRGAENEITKQRQIKFSNFKYHTSCTRQYAIYTTPLDSYEKRIDMKMEKLKNRNVKSEEREREEILQSNVWR